MVLKFEDYIKEGFMSKTYDRLKSGEKRMENTIGLNSEEKKIYDLFGELCTGGEYNNQDNIKKFSKVLHNVDNKKYESFISNIFTGLEHLGCSPTTFRDAVKSVKDGNCVVLYSTYDGDDYLHSEFMMWGLIDDHLAKIGISQELEKDGEISLRIVMTSDSKAKSLATGDFHLSISDDYDVQAFEIPINVFTKIVSQNKRIGSYTEPIWLQ